MSEDQAAPLLQVITPDATPEEVAALVAVVAALGSRTAAAPRKPKPTWSDPARLHRPRLHAGPGAWRASGLPR